MTFKDFALMTSVNPNQSDLEIVKSFLFKEYNYLLPFMEKVKLVEFKLINLEDISYHINRLDSIQSSDLNSYKLEQPIIVHQRHTLWLIDGYHRVAKAKNSNHNNILSIILKE